MAEKNGAWLKNGYKITCCKDCPDRYPGCHGKCEKYIQQKAEYDSKKEEYMKKFNIAAGLSEQKYDSMNKVVRYRHYREKYRKGH